jgi:hypothetical protein
MLQVCVHWTASLERRPSSQQLQAQCLLYKTGRIVQVHTWYLFYVCTVSI